MYHRIVRSRVLTTFAHLNRHDYRQVVETFSPHITHRFAGDHALGGARHSRTAAQRWYERLFRLFPDLRFFVENVVVMGLPHHTQVAVQFRVELTNPAGEPYENKVAQFIRIRWGKIVHIDLYEDTSKLVRLLNMLSDCGTTEATAAPITD